MVPRGGIKDEITPRSVTLKRTRTWRQELGRDGPEVMKDGSGVVVRRVLLLSPYSWYGSPPPRLIGAITPRKIDFALDLWCVPPPVRTAIHPSHLPSFPSSIPHLPPFLVSLSPFPSCWFTRAPPPSAPVSLLSQVSHSYPHSLRLSSSPPDEIFMAIHAASVGATAAAIRATGVSAFKELGPVSIQRESEWGLGGWRSG